MFLPTYVYVYVYVYISGIYPLSFDILFFLTFINVKQIFIPFLYLLTQYHAQQDI